MATIATAPTTTPAPQASPPAPTDQDLIPIVLGVVGHRELRDSDVPALSAAIKAVLEEFQSAYPHTPLVLLSSLAAGADQLAARVALDCGWSIRAPLPFPPDAFRASTSFQNDAERQALDQLLQDTRVEWFVAPLPPTVAPPAGGWPSVVQGEAGRDLRRLCYANSGGYIVRHCHALLALWDGNPGDPNRPSGTAEIVAFQLSGRPLALYPWRDAEPLGFRGDRGPLVVVHTPRAGAQPADAPPQTPAGQRSLLVPVENKPLGEPVADPWLVRRLSPGARFLTRVVAALGLRRHRPGGDEERQQFMDICQVIDDFNRDARSAWDNPGLRRRFQRVEEDLAAAKVAAPPALAASGDGQDGADDLAPAKVAAKLRRLLRVRETAAHLSNKLQPWLDGTYVLLFLLLAAALLCFHLYAHWIDSEVPHPPHPALGFAGFLLLLAVAAGLVCYVWWVRLDERRLDYRALAEALRVRRAWALAGIGRSVSNSYLGQLRGELVWARRAVQHVCPPSSVWSRAFEQLPPAEQHERLQFVRQTWVQHQARQFEKSHKKEHGASWLFRGVGFLLALVGWAMLASLVFVGDVHHPPELLLIASSMLVILGGLAIAFCERRSHEELAKQYERMQVIYTNGEAELEARLSEAHVKGAQAALEELGREAIAENAQWLILRRNRPLELHIGG
jgi:hypothetical protein